MDILHRHCTGERRYPTGRTTDEGTDELCDVSNASRVYCIITRHWAVAGATGSEENGTDRWTYLCSKYLVKGFEELLTWWCHLSAVQSLALAWIRAGSGHKCEPGLFRNFIGNQGFGSWRCMTPVPWKTRKAIGPAPLPLVVSDCNRAMREDI